MLAVLIILLVLFFGFGAVLAFGAWLLQWALVLLGAGFIVWLALALVCLLSGSAEGSPIPAKPKPELTSEQWAEVQEAAKASRYWRRA